MAFIKTNRAEKFEPTKVCTTCKKLTCTCSK